MHSLLLGRTMHPCGSPTPDEHERCATDRAGSSSIRNLNELAALTALTGLILSHCSLAELPSALSRLHRLRLLSLHNSLDYDENEDGAGEQDQQVWPAGWLSAE